MPVEPTVQPGVGVGHATATDRRRRGIKHVDGRRGVPFHRDDPDCAARVLAIEDHETQRVGDPLDATNKADHITDVDRRPDAMSTMDWRIFALAMFIAPLTVSGVGLAVSHGFVEALVAAVLAVVLLAAYLTRHRRPRSTS